ncbi:MAG: hypothetical protein IPN59_13790 [Holophaga sp.]|nr:hypothetical protein [Holophaga sp.]
MRRRIPSLPICRRKKKHESIFLSAGLLAPVFLVVFFILLLVFSGLAKKQRRELREIPGFLQLRKVVGQAVEAGSRLQIALGSRGLYDQDGASALAGLTILQRIAQAASISDSPPIATLRRQPCSALKPGYPADCLPVCQS